MEQARGPVTFGGLLVVKMTSCCGRGTSVLGCLLRKLQGVRGYFVTPTGTLRGFRFF